MKPHEILSSKIRIRQLRCFVFVARKKSFVLAAEALGLTQPAVSRSVRELEQIIGQNLFDRSQRGAQLTPHGKTFLEAAELGLMQISQGVASITERERIVETIRIGALPNVCSQFLPEVVRDFKSARPEVTVRVLPGTNADLLDGLRRGETDVVIGRLSESGDMRGLVFEALYDEPLIFVVGNHHRLAGAAATLEEALAYPLVLPPVGTIIRAEIDRFLSGQGVSALPDIVETTSSDFQRAYLRQTACVLAVPRGVVQDQLRSGEVVRLPIGDRSLTGPVGLTTNPSTETSPALGHLLSDIRDSVST